MLTTKFKALSFGLTTAVFLVGCSGSVHAPDAATKNAANAEMSKNLVGAGKSTSTGNEVTYTPSMKVDSAPASNFSAESPDMKAETEVDETALKAWRLAVKGDEQHSLKMISELDKKYPKFKTVAAMHAQILEHFGRKQEALKFYEEATSGNDFDLLHTFKMARACRTTGDTKVAIEKYRKLVKEAPDFSPGKFGLAQALLSEDKNSVEAHDLLSSLNADDRATLEAEEAVNEKAGKSLPNKSKVTDSTREEKSNK